MEAKNIYKIAWVIIVLFLMGCSTNKPDETMENSDIIEITKDQFLSENMEFGIPENHVFKDEIQFVGKIVPKVDGMAQISVPVEGIVKKIYVQSGQIVKKGESLIEIGGNAFVDMQQQFTTSAAKLKQLKAEYERAHLLYKENIKVENEFFKIESDYKSELGNYSALKLKLNQLGINTDEIEKGSYYKTYIISAPIDGQIVNENCNLGQYVSKEEHLVMVVNNKKVQIEISVFEKDLSKVKINQNVVFAVLGDSNKYRGNIASITKLISDKSKSSNCYAEVMDNDYDFSINQLVNGSIITDVDTLLSLPKSAIVKSDEFNYIFIKEGELNGNYQLKKSPVEIGKADENNIQILNYKLNREVLISGTYNLNVD